MMRTANMIALALVGGCVAMSEDPANTTVPLNPEATCPAAQYQSLIGQPVDDAAFDWPAQKLRIVGPGQAMTMDFRPDRLTVSYDKAGRITSLQCV